MSKTIPADSQLLSLPIRDMGVTAGYKNAKYLAQFGFRHYGIDAISESGDKTVYAMGNGEVLAAGLDGTAGDWSGMGWVTVIRYNKVYIPSTGKVLDLIATTFHHEAGSVQVKAGDMVTAETVIARYGNTGGTTLPSGARMGNHLHMQLDTDVDWPLYCYGISGRGSRILKCGTADSTMNPFDVLVADVARKQYAYTRDSGWAEDWTSLPESVGFEVTEGCVPKAGYDALRWKYTELEADYQAVLARLDRIHEMSERVG